LRQLPFLDTVGADLPDCVKIDNGDLDFLPAIFFHRPKREEIMRYITGDDRYQITTEFCCLDDMIEADNMIRIIDLFVDELDLERHSFTNTNPKARGRKPYNPGDLLKLYIYGYLNRINSSRKLERECKRNIEVRWLLGNLSPDFKTIADFRKDNRDNLKNVFREFTYICRRADLIDFKLAAIDGSFFSAVNHNSKNYSRNKLRKLIGRLDRKIDEYLDEISRMDKQDLSKISDMQQAIADLRSKQREYREIQDVLEATGETQVSLTDPHSKMMTKPQSKTDMSYNVQLVVDSKNSLIAECDVTNDGNDKKQLSRMVEKVLETHTLSELTVVADEGYSSGEEIDKCQEMNVGTYVPVSEKKLPRKDDPFCSANFTYIPEEDCYLCPAGKKLPKSSVKKGGKEITYCRRNICKDCLCFTQCVPSGSKYKIIHRNAFEEALQRQRERNQMDRDKMRLRQSIVEHPFGTIKRHMRLGDFLTRGLRSVNGEFSLIALAYNMLRAFNILGFDRLKAAIQVYFAHKEDIGTVILSFLGNILRLRVAYTKSVAFM